MWPKPWFRVVTFSSVARLQSLIIGTVLAEASVFASGLNAKPTMTADALRLPMFSPLAASQTLIVLSPSPADAMSFPSGLNCRAQVCPWRTRFGFPVSTSHSLMVLSQTSGSQCLAVRAVGYRSNIASVPFKRGDVVAGGHVPEFDRSVTLADARTLPSGLKATDVTRRLWPCNVAVHRVVPTSHSLIVRSSLAEASVLPSALNANDITGAVWPESEVAASRADTPAGIAPSPPGRFSRTRKPIAPGPIQGAKLPRYADRAASGELR